MGTMGALDAPFYQQSVQYMKKDFDQDKPFFSYLIT